MQEHPQPEMTRLSLQDLALRIKIMKIGTQGIEETLLKALDPPTSPNITRAIGALIEVKALTANEEITPLGRHLAKLPMDVHLGLFLIMSCIFNCLDAALTITVRLLFLSVLHILLTNPLDIQAALNSKSPWITPFGRESEADAVKRGFKIENSDFLTTYNAYCCWRDSCSNNYEHQFIRVRLFRLISQAYDLVMTVLFLPSLRILQKSFLSLQNLQQIEELRQQFFSFLVDAGFVNIRDSERRQLVSTRYGKSRTKFTRVPPELDTSSKDPRAVMACLAASMYPKLLTIDPQNGSLRTLSNSAPAAIHPSSVNFSPGRRVDFGPNARFASFFTAMHTKKLYIWESGGVDERAVYLLCGNADFQVRLVSVFCVLSTPSFTSFIATALASFNAVTNRRACNSSPPTPSPSTARSARTFTTPKPCSPSSSSAKSGARSSSAR
jgi:ATP-dependent RNA helicase DHX29